MPRAKSLTAAAAGVVLLVAAPTAARAATDPAHQIRHVWVIVLENEGYAATYVTNPNHYLSRALPAAGALLTQYYATGHASNDNYVSMISGQAPSASNQSDCQDYVNLEPGVIGPSGQAVGQGCVYPATVETLANQLDAAHLSWKGYFEDMGNDPAREPDRCGDPGNPTGVGSRDGTQSASTTDQYAARHNPFVYFHSILDTGACQTHVVPLTQFKGDLASATTTPNFSFVVPNLCDDGHDNPCTGVNQAGTHTGGLYAVDLWLRRYVPLITNSAAFHQGGLIVITTDEAATSDTTDCCGEQPGPNSPMPGITGPGGGLVGSVVIGTCVRPGTKDATPYNHYSLLRSLENIFGITRGGTDGHGHLGYAAATGLAAFGRDVFTACTPTPVGEQPRPTGTTATPGGSVTKTDPAPTRLVLTGGPPFAIPGAALLLAAAALKRRSA